MHGVDLAPDTEVLITDQNHPSNALAWQTRAARHGFAVRQVSLPAAPADGVRRFTLVYTVNTFGVVEPTGCPHKILHDGGVSLH